MENLVPRHVSIFLLCVERALLAIKLNFVMPCHLSPWSGELPRWPHQLRKEPPHSVSAITRADPVDPALSNSPLGDSRNHSVLQRREGNAGLQPRMVLEDLLGGHQSSVSPGESSHYLFIRNECYCEASYIEKARCPEVRIPESSTNPALLCGQNRAKRQ